MKKIINLCNEYGDSEKSFWGIALNFFVDKSIRENMDEKELEIINEYFQKFLDYILEKKSILPMNVLDIINEKNNDIPLDILRAFIDKTLESEIKPLDEKVTNFEGYNNQLKTTNNKIKEIQTQATSFKLSKNEPLLAKIEEQMEKEEESNINNSIRKGFITKVYSLLLIQLGITFGFVFLSMNIKSLAIFILVHIWLYIIMMIIPFIILIYFICNPQSAQKVPINYILLFIFCISLGYTVARFTLHFKNSSVYFAMLLTFIAVLGLTIYSFFTKKDFTTAGSTLFIFLIILIFGGIINIFLKLAILHFILNVVGVFLFSFYIIYDTQLIIGGKNNKLSEDDYILAVMMLYLDVINLFIYILSLCGNNK